MKATIEIKQEHANSKFDMDLSKVTIEEMMQAHKYYTEHGSFTGTIKGEFNIVEYKED